MDRVTTIPSGINTRTKEPSTRSPHLTLDELKRHIPSTEIVMRDLYGVVAVRGRARCVFPERHNNGDSDHSLRFNKERVFCASRECFGEKGADQFSAVQIIENVDFQAAFRRLADHYMNAMPPAAATVKAKAEKAPATAEWVRGKHKLDGWSGAITEHYYGDDLRKVRIEHATEIQAGKGRPAKEFVWEHFDGKVWRSGLGGRAIPLYVNKVFRERDRIEAVVGVEGEAKAEFAGQLGFAAFSFREINADAARALVGMNVYLWPDADAKGIEYAQKALALISPHAGAVELLNPPDGLPIAGDIVDAVEKLGWNSGDIRKYLTSGPAEPEKPKAPQFHDVQPSSQYPAPLGEEAYHGIAGELIRLIEPHTEADPSFMLVQFLAYAGNYAGRKAYVQAGGDCHYPNLFVCGVGPTSSGRKGSAAGPMSVFFEGVDGNWVRSFQSGLSTGEGLIWCVRDAITKREKKAKTSEYEEILIDEGIADKRLLVQQSEFYGALQVMKRAGNTLSPTIRDAWDRGNLNSMVKSSPTRATEAHISIVANITKEELLRGMQSDEMDNGFANRFLWACSKRSRFLPEGGTLWRTDFQPLRKRLALNLDVVTGRIERSNEAAEMWGRNDRPDMGSYAFLTRERHGMFGTCTARAAAQVLRLSLIYALLDASPEICPVHLSAALEVWRYCEESARYIFGEALGNSVADEILQNLRITPAGLTRAEIRDLFNRHKSKSELDTALLMLREGGLAYSQDKPTNGRPIEQWFAIKKKA